MNKDTKKHLDELHGHHGLAWKKLESLEKVHTTLYQNHEQMWKRLESMEEKLDRIYATLR